MRDGHAMSIHNPKETKRTPAGEGGGCEVSSCTINETSSSWNLQDKGSGMIQFILKQNSSPN
jgi:hypothetical protein